VFAEGTTSNGQSLLEFKKGAFMAERAVTPVVIKYEGDMLDNSYDVIPFLPFFILHMSSFNFNAVIYELPAFIPNEYLYKKAASTGKERWQVFSESVRDIMSKGASLKLTTQDFTEKEA
jgi:1-acyl-sn-glycerol-3-phosphate acyltransferase